MELNHLPLGYEPNELPMLYPAIVLVEPRELESRLSECKSDVPPTTLWPQRSLITIYYLTHNVKQKLFQIHYHLDCWADPNCAAMLILFCNLYLMTQ